MSPRLLHILKCTHSFPCVNDLTFTSLLTFSPFNLPKNSAIFVTQATVNGKFITVAKDRAKNKSSLRTLPLVATFKELLLRIKEEQRICGKNYCTEYLEYIYLDPDGKLIRPDFVTQHFALMLKKNCRKICIHDLRHSCASLLFSHGVSLKEIQEWLGHSNISTTANIYTRMDFKETLINTLINSLDYQYQHFFVILALTPYE